MFILFECTPKPRRTHLQNIGILKEYDEESITIGQEEGTNMKFARSDIALIRLALDF